MTNVIDDYHDNLDANPLTLYSGYKCRRRVHTYGRTPCLVNVVYFRISDDVYYTVFKRNKNGVNYGVLDFLEFYFFS